MTSNEILQIVIFSIFFGVACTAIGDYAKPLIQALEIASHVILKMVGYVMNFCSAWSVWSYCGGDCNKRPRSF